LDEGLGGVDGHFFMELDEAEAGTAVNGGELVEFSALDEVGDEFDIDLDEVAWARDREGSSVPFGAKPSFAGQAVTFEDFADGKGGGNLSGAVVEEELTEPHGAQMGLFS